MWGKIKKFLREVRAELKKVSWPSREQMISSTWAVIIASLLCAAYIGAADYVFQTALTALLKTAS